MSLKDPITVQDDDEIKGVISLPVDPPQPGDPVNVIGRCGAAFVIWHEGKLFLVPEPSSMEDATLVTPWS